MHADDPALDAEHMDDLISLWLETIAADVAPATLDGYRQKVEHFRRWWMEAGPPCGWKLTRRTLAEFGRYLAATPSSRPPHRPPGYGQQADVLRRLKQMFRWAKAAGYTDIDHGDWLPRPTGEPTKRKAPTLCDLAALMEAAGKSASPTRDRALLALLIGTGVRRAEAASLQIEETQIAADGSGVATVTGKRTTANQDGRRAVAFDATTGAYLVALLDADKRTAGPMFVTDAGDRMSYQAIHRAVKRAIHRAGLDQKIVGCHDLRRAFATHLARHARADPTLSADLIRRQMGHTSYTMTAHYSLLDVDDLRDMIVSPLAMEGTQIQRP